MIAKVCVFLAVVAAVSAGGLVGIGAPLLGAGHLGTGLVSAQSTAINHVAPVGRVAVAAPLALGHGIAAPAAIGYGGYGLGGYGGYGLGGYGLGHGLVGGNLRADGIVGHGILGARYGNAIAHNAVVGLGHGVGVYGLGNGAGVLGLGHGVGVAKALL